MESDTSTYTLRLYIPCKVDTELHLTIMVVCGLLLPSQLTLTDIHLTIQLVGWHFSLHTISLHEVFTFIHYTNSNLQQHVNI